MQNAKEIVFLFVVLIISIVINESSGDVFGFSCSDDDDCSSFADKQTLSDCINNVCKCTVIKSKNVANCTPRMKTTSNKVGQKCPCRIPNGSCNITTTECVCNEGFMVTEDKLRCIKVIVPLGEPCEMSKQCENFDNHAMCHESMCRCQSNFTMYEKTCRALLKVGEKCEINVQCTNTSSNVSCLNHECTCDNFFVASNDGSKCLPYKNYQEDCEESTQCENGLGPGSFCDNGKCNCDNDHSETSDGTKTICQRTIRYGDACKEHDDCSHYLKEQTMKCTQKKCVCRDGYELYDAYTKKCVAIQVSGVAGKASKLFGSFVLMGIAIFVILA